MYLLANSLYEENSVAKVGYQIQEKDILKLGRVKFYVKQIGRSEEVKQPQEEIGNNANSKLLQYKFDDALFEEITDVPQLSYTQIRTQKMILLLPLFTFVSLDSDHVVVSISILKCYRGCVISREVPMKRLLVLRIFKEV